MQSKTFVERFWAKVDKRGPDECWNWTAAQVNYGYGVIDRERAHRASYVLAFGPIPRGLEVKHSCDNPSCVNPAHLSAGTHAENMAEMAARGRANGGGPPGERHGMAKLTYEQVRAIRLDPLPHRAAAKKYGVSKSMISFIRRGENWKEPAAQVQQQGV